ncbi:MAG TPA: hypothetical protein DDY52_03375 [Candidatus Moranbacteria bacterium]|nr:hypothetical protein [Candidatus Moranbacteria bacterium]
MDEDFKRTGDCGERETSDSLRGEIENEMIRQTQLIEKLGLIIPKLDERLAVVLLTGQEKSEVGEETQISTELGKELNQNNRRLASILDNVKNIIDRIEL